MKINWRYDPDNRSKRTIPVPIGADIDTAINAGYYTNWEKSKKEVEFSEIFGTFYQNSCKTIVGNLY
ncbi:hypothetical protein FACS1894189_6450 [Planctomycetales bacterium]|nr:hypothetical protein FACS1894189_6450 [Planctomycetales bacterium]